MNATITNSPGQDSPSAQKIMGKPVIETNTRILNLDSGFQHKYLCAGTACAYRCSYCCVETIVGTKPFVTSLLGGNRFQDVVIRRKDADYAVDYAFCKGCGICVAECPRSAMEMSA